MPSGISLAFFPCLAEVNYRENFESKNELKFQYKDDNAININSPNLISGILISIIAFCVEIFKESGKDQHGESLETPQSQIREKVAKTMNPKNWAKDFKGFNPKNILDSQKMKEIYIDLRERARNMYVEEPSQRRIYGKQEQRNFP